MSDCFDVAVIGAGVAGLTCAQQLQQAGYSVVVLEKSRGLGGRLATRRLYGTCADHGARYLQPQGDLLRRLVHFLSDRGVVEPWSDTTYKFDCAKGQLQPMPASWFVYYAAPAGMSAIGKVLATDLQVWRNRRVVGMTPNPDKSWHLSLEVTDNNVEMPNFASLQVKGLVVAIPAPQALSLFQPLESILPLDFLDSLRSVEFEPCLSVMAGYAEERQGDLARLDRVWRSVEFEGDGHLAWVGWDSSKRILSSVPVFVLQSTGTFAAQYLEAEDLQPAADELLSRAAGYLLPWLSWPAWVQVHRWRYAFASRPWPHSCLAVSEPLPLVCCGDWCGGGNIEGALNSAVSAAAAINKQLQQLPLPGEGFWYRFAE